MKIICICSCVCVGSVLIQTYTVSGNQVIGDNTSTSVQTDTSNSTQIGGDSQTSYTRVEPEIH